MGAHFQPVLSAAVSRVLATFTREELAGFIAIAIDLLDLAEGDPDLEPNGDELDGTGAEDDFLPEHIRDDGWPGDPGDAEDDDPAGDPLDSGEGDTFEGGGGSSFDARIEGTRPRYGKDQTRGPVDIAEATREYQMRLRLGAIPV